MSALLLAIRYLTILPVRAPGQHGTGALGRSAAWFPVVGLAIGALVAGFDALAVKLFSPLVSAVLTVAFWTLLTGGLHLDGLADCLDSLMGRDREHRLAIMRDSRIGTFGALGLVFVLGLEVVAVAELPSTVRWRLLVATPAVGRAVPPLLARLFGAARHDGQGAAFVASVGRAGTVTALVLAVVAATVVAGAAGAIGAALAVTAAIVTAAFLARRVGGVTGDILGAAVETAEVTLILTGLAWPGARD